jgi:hypothetical protein
MDRRTFMGGVSAGLLAAPRSDGAEQPGKAVGRADEVIQ